jgi:hypothetical protein
MGDASSSTTVTRPIQVPNPFRIHNHEWCVGRKHAIIGPISRVGFTSDFNHSYNEFRANPQGFVNCDIARFRTMPYAAIAFAVSSI